MTTSRRGEIATLEVMMTHKARRIQQIPTTCQRPVNDLSTTCQRPVNDLLDLVEGCPLEWREDTALGGSCSKILGRLEALQIFTELMSPLRCTRRTSPNLGHCGRTASGIWESPEHCEDRTGGHSDSQHRSRHCAQNVWHLRQLGHLCRGALGWRGESGGRREAYDATASGRRPKCQMEHRLLRFSGCKEMHFESFWDKKRMEKIHWQWLWGMHDLFFLRRDGVLDSSWAEADAHEEARATEEKWKEMKDLAARWNWKRWKRVKGYERFMNGL